MKLLLQKIDCTISHISKAQSSSEIRLNLCNEIDMIEVDCGVAQVRRIQREKSMWKQLSLKAILILLVHSTWAIESTWPTSGHWLGHRHAFMHLQRSSVGNAIDYLQRRQCDGDTEKDTRRKTCKKTPTNQKEKDFFYSEQIMDSANWCIKRQ